MESTQFASMIAVVKQILKRKNITYVDLAERIGMSESGLKKALTSDDGSVGRLDSICRAIGISLFDLVQMVISDSPAKEFSLPLPIQEHFLNDLDCFRVFWILVYDECPPEKAPEQLGMRPSEFWRHARQLDRFGLISVGAENHIVLPKRDHIVWINDGPLVAWTRRHWTQQVLDAAIGQKNSPEHFLSLRFLRLTKASRDELLLAIKDLNREFGTRSLRERLVNADEDLVPMRMVVATAPGSFVAAKK